MINLITTNPKQVSVLIDIWTQKLRDLNRGLVDSPCWSYEPNETQARSGFIPKIDGGGTYRGQLNMNDADEGSLGAYSGLQYLNASNLAKERYRLNPEDCDRLVDTYLSEDDIFVDFRCWFYDHIENSNSRHLDERFSKEPFFHFQLLAFPDGADDNLIDISPAHEALLADLSKERMEAIAESQIKYFKEQMLGNKS
jgi:hypothetical protein